MQTTFYPNASGDGMVGITDTTWIAARSATDGSEKNTTGSFVSFYSWCSGTNNYRIERGFLPFDTSSIPDTDIIESAILKVYFNKGGSSENYGTSFNACLVQSSQASNTALVYADFDTLGATEGANRVDTFTAGWKTFTLNSTGLSWISKTGYTKLGIKTELDFDNISPIDYVKEIMSAWYTSEDSTKKPQLIITHWGLDRYWVGGSGNWSDITHWSDSSGGTGGAPVPTATNNVYFDANSGFTAGSKTVTFDGINYPSQSQICANMDWTGATNNPIVAGVGDLRTYGTVTFIAGMVWNHTGLYYPVSQTGSKTFTSQGISFACHLVFVGESGGTWVLGDNLTVTNLISFISGTLNTNGKTVNCYGFNSSNTNTRTLTLGASTINCSGDWNLTTVTNLTLNAGTSTINMTGNNTSWSSGNSKTYYIVNFQNNQTIDFSNTFTTIAFTAGKQYIFYSANTQTVTNFTATGSAGNLITFRSYYAGSQFTFSKASGTVTCDYLDLKDCVGSGGAAFIAGDNSVDSGNNTGWTNAWTNPANAYSSNDSYATHTSPSGKLYIKLSGDGGTTWTNALYKTFTGTEGSQTYGDGATEKWGTYWTGDNVDDVSFRVKIYADSPTSFNYMTLYTFGFDVDITSTKVLNGIEISAEAKYDAGTLSIDHIKIKCHYGTTNLPITEGSLLWNNDADTFGGYDGTNWKMMVPVEWPWTNITTYAGWAANPILILRYTQIGKMVYVVGNLNGTSNASGHTITLPVAMTNITGNEIFACISRQRVGDVYEAPGIILLTGGSTTAGFYRYGDGTNFPATGVLAIWFQFFYEVA